MASSLGPDKKITDGLVLYLDATNPKSYPGSGGSWFDLISNESTGAFINGPTATASFGGSKIVFDATNDYIRIKNRDSLNPTQYVTAASWFVYKTTGVYYPPVIFKKTTGNSYYEQYLLSVDGGYVYGKIGNGSNSNAAVASSRQYINELIYGLVVIDTPARAMRVYVDGTCVGSGSHPYSTMATSTVDLAIGGSDVSNFFGWFGGDIYTAEVYNRVLTDAEILQNYNSVAEKFGKNVVVTDLDAMAFINKAMLSSETQKKAVNDLTVDMKTAGIWSKMKAIYPFVGGTAASHKWNLKNPQDTNASFRLTFNGGWTHSSTGVKPNGTNAYANSWMIPNGNLTAGNVHLAYYSRTSNLVNEYEEIIGAQSDPVFDANKRVSLIFNTGSTSLTGVLYNSNASYTYTSSAGFLLAARTSSSDYSRLYFQGNLVATASALGTPSNYTQATFYIGASNNNPAVFFSHLECAFASIGDGLTDAESKSFYTAVQKFQTTLGREIDMDAQTFIVAAGITNATQQNAINKLVVDMKTAGIWSKMKAIYPFVGGTAASHKWNLKDPRDLDAAFRLTFTGGWTHSASGSLPNGTNAYADTYVVSSNHLSLNDVAVSVYIRTNTQGTYMMDLCDQDTARKIYLSSWFNVSGFGSNGVIAQLHNSGFQGGIANSDPRGFYLSSRTGSSAWGVYKNNSKIGTRTVTSSIDNQPTKSILLAGNILYSLEYSSREQAFATIGNGLTDTEASSLYTIVQTYQTTLGRQV
jgi:hypothetical protein